MSLDAFGGEASKPVIRAVARARYLAARTYREGETRESNEPEYAFNPNETVPTAISSQSGTFVVADQSEYYRLSFEEQPALVPTFDIEMTEVADSPETFDTWFVDEYVTVDEIVSTR
ncbi:hypothetical protein [Halovivax gelatinilyticus]|uniref:hypothetical protein n=1 Tax=Halovivax gelatinilyticus TaxID=2961597 RepID=UPI0020CA42FB|nr:hypothetical protein [Halovivax gelatinilyticus]